MWEPSTIAEKKFNAETHRLIAERQLHEFGLFLDTFNETIAKYKKKFINSHNVTVQPVLLEEQVYKNETILSLVHSDNTILSRILACLGGICKEIRLLVKDAESMYKQFIFYGENGNSKDLGYLEISGIIEALQKIHLFVLRSQQVVILTLRQLSAILGKGFYVSTSTTSFPEIFNHLGDVLICLIKFESLLELQMFKDHWFSYRRLIKTVAHNHAKYNFDRQQLQSFDKNLTVLENNLLTGRILKDTLEKCLEDKDFYYQMKSCSLSQELHSFLNTILNDLEKDEDSVFSTELWLKLNTLFVLQSNVFGNADKKMVKRILDLNKKISACTLIGNILWYPEQFLLKHIQSLSKTIDEKVIESFRLSLISSKCQNLLKEINVVSLQACYFLVELKKIAALNTSNLKVKHLQAIGDLLTDSLRLVKKISFSISWILNLHTDKNLPVTKSVLMTVCKLTEILKAIYLVFHNNSLNLTYIILLISQHLSYKAIMVLHGIKKQFTQEKTYKEHQLDVLSSLNVCERALKGPVTNDSLLVANLALSASGLSTSSLTEIRGILNKLELITNFGVILRSACDCSFLYWHQSYILPIYFSKLISSKADLSRYYLMLAGLTDCAKMAGMEATQVSSKIIKDNFFTQLDQIIETNLRLQTHLHLQLPPTDPFQNYFSLNFRKYQPVPLDQIYKSLKNDAEHYLSTMFYNLTTVVLHDWKTYGEMRRLASMQYGLETVDDNLPMQTLEQGLDVLEIMRNINVFVSKYLYNLNSQVFIEESSNNKHLNSINISHVANSIRTHGIGIMNTTVNFTYQFLRSKFYIFSQFMFDEHIKSRLLKDLRYFADHKAELNQMYPYERAEKFHVSIRKLGLNQNGESYLDLFRKLITHIGNAMGYIRLIRSGGRRCLADGTCFIPDLKSIQNLNDIIKEEEMSDLSKKSATCLCEDLRSFLDNIEDATEYFKLLVKVFVPVLRSRDNVHLNNFYMIVPPLTINFIEHSLNSKEKLNKKNKANCAFTDDGFALGLAYIVELLNQESQLNSLHWFHSVQKKFKNDRLKVKEQATVTNNEDPKLTQALTLTHKRIVSFERELQLLYYSFNSARLFFQT